MAPAEYEGDLGDIGDHGDSIGSREQRIRDPLIRHGLNLLQHLGGREQPALFARAGMCNIYNCGGGEHCREKQRRGDFFSN